ncbi:unnamed protein product [Amoebophrya sp. A25]|nr:unnamed protein product [Amoebophrya sp. A25]|eukprot:GSA25T00021243001.1
MNAKIYLGIIKSYNAGNGYGFIECKDTLEVYQRDIFLHRVEFESAGADVGNTVRFQVTLSDRGQPRAVNVTRAGGAPSPPAQVQPSPAYAVIGPPKPQRPIGEAKMFGQIRTFNQEKGYGFVQSEHAANKFGQADVFLHYTQAINFRVGDFVYFDCVMTEQGKPQARGLIKAADVDQQQQQQAYQPAPATPQVSYQAGPAQQVVYAAAPAPPQQLVYAAAASPQALYQPAVYQTAPTVLLQPGPYGQVRMAKGGKPMKGAPGMKGGAAAHMGAHMGGQAGAGLNLLKEYQGVLSKYFADKGFGFIENEEVKSFYAKDTWISKQEVDAHGLNIGDQVTFKLRIEKNMPQADVIGKTGAMREEGESKLEMIGPGPHLGIIKSYNEQKGFGFIQCPEIEAHFGCDVFMHRREMNETHMVGKEVQFTIQLNQKGKPQASEITVIGDGVTAGDAAFAAKI